MPCSIRCIREMNGAADANGLVGRLEQKKLCVLAMIRVRADGRKELVALTGGYRESNESWADLLRDCRRRGMRAPVLAVGDGALGFCAALPKSAHPGALAMRDTYHAEDVDKAQVTIRASAIDYGTKYPRRWPRSSTTPTCCWTSTGIRPSIAPPILLTAPSPPCVYPPRSPNVPAERGRNRHGYELIEAAQARWRAVNAPHLVALVCAGATSYKGKLLERPVDITPGHINRRAGTRRITGRLGASYAGCETVPTLPSRHT